MKFIIFVNVKLKFIIFEGKRPLVEIDQWPEQTYYTWIFIKLTHFFIKTDKIERVTRIVCMTHGFGLAVSSCHCFTDLLSSSIHFVFAGLERGKYEDPEVGEGDIRGS